MNWSMVWAVLAAAGIPSAIVGLLVAQLNKKIDRREKASEEREQARIKSQTMIIKLVMAALSLGEATAEAVQRIPDAHCNGDMEAALNYAKQIKAEYRDFEHEQTAKTVVVS